MNLNGKQQIWNVNKPLILVQLKNKPPHQIRRKITCLEEMRAAAIPKYMNCWIVVNLHAILNLDLLAVILAVIAVAGSIPGLCCDDAVPEIKIVRPSVRWLSGPEGHERVNVVRPLLRFWLPGERD